MRQVLIRSLDDETVRLLKANAARSGRSFEEECRSVLRRAARERELLCALERWRAEDEGLVEDDPFADVRPRDPPRPVDLG